MVASNLADSLPPPAWSLSEYIAPLRVPPRDNCNSRSGYRNVYYCGRNLDGTIVWQAKIKFGRRLIVVPGTSPEERRSTDPRVCALAVARWYERQFGSGWRELARSNARRRPPWRVWRSKLYGGYVAWVWILGRPVELVPFDKKGCPQQGRRPLVFATAAEARGAVWPWVERQYPGRAREVVYRAEAV